jgi:hypothetical protein
MLVVVGVHSFQSSAPMILSRVLQPPRQPVQAIARAKAMNLADFILAGCPPSV